MERIRDEEHQMNGTWTCTGGGDWTVNTSYRRRLEPAGRTSVERAQGGFMDLVKEDRKSIEADDWLQPLLREQP